MSGLSAVVFDKASRRALAYRCGQRPPAMPVARQQPRARRREREPVPPLWTCVALLSSLGPTAHDVGAELSLAASESSFPCLDPEAAAAPFSAALQTGTLTEGAPAVVDCSLLDPQASMRASRLRCLPEVLEHAVPSRRAQLPLH